MGHAGAFAERGEEKAAEKIRLLEDAGVVMTDHPAKFGTIMKELLKTKPVPGIKNKDVDARDRHISENIDIYARRDQPQRVHQAHSQKRSLHSYARRPLHTTNRSVCRRRRNISFKGSKALTILNKSGIPVAPDITSTGEQLMTVIEVDRMSHQLRLHMIKSSPNDNERECEGALYLNVSDSSRSMVKGIQKLFDNLKLRPDLQNNFHTTIDSLTRLFIEKEASSFKLQLVPDKTKLFTAQNAILSFDDAAYRSAGRHKDIQALRTAEDEIPEEVEAENDGIVYIKYVYSLKPCTPKSLLTRTHHRLPGNGNIGSLGTPYPRDRHPPTR